MPAHEEKRHPNRDTETPAYKAQKIHTQSMSASFANAAGATQSHCRTQDVDEHLPDTGGHKRLDKTRQTQEVG